MATPWIMVRVSLRTHARLTELRDQMMAAYQAGHAKVKLPDEYAEDVPLHYVIDQLIDQIHAHRRRARASRHRRAKDSKTPTESTEREAREACIQVA